ncbi:MAG: helix-turn-helix domain-containing protein [Chitinophagaceae bacterium]
MDKIIVTTPFELEHLIQKTISKFLSENTTLASESTKQILNISEASEFLNLAKQTLYGFTSKNEIPFIKRGKKLYFRKTDLESWLLEGKQLTKNEVELGGFVMLSKKNKGK